MSARENEDKDAPPQGRIVTDSVHQRFKHQILYCPSCEENFPANMIDKHFVRSHESDEPCVYCSGKVFRYILFEVNADGNEVPKRHTYHSCSVRN